jgi:hypothetical protein
MMVGNDVADDGCELVIYGMVDLLAHRTLGDIVSDETLRDLVPRELFAESKVCSTISELAIAAAMDRVESRGDIVCGNYGNGVLGS